MNRNLLLLTLAVVAFFVIIFISGAAFYSANVVFPTKQAIATARKEDANQAATATKSVSLTLTAAPTITPSLTLTPSPTLTLSPTLTPSPTPTATATIPVAVTNCEGVMIRDDNYYPYPSRGTKKLAKSLLKGQSINVIGRPYDNGWYWIEAPNKSRGWVARESLSIGDCHPNIYDLSYMFGALDSGNRLVFDDTFGSNLYTWIDTNGNNSIVPQYDGSENGLRIISGGTTYVLPQGLSLDNLSDFKLWMSVKISNFRPGSSFGVRFFDSGNAYSQVEVVPYSSSAQQNCQVTYRADAQEAAPSKLDPVSCLDNWYDVLLEVNDKELGLTVNGAEEVRYGLQGVNPLGRLGITANNGEVEVLYFIVTNP